MVNKREGKRPFCEHEVIGACALRFDGYKYRDETGIDVDSILDKFFETGDWDASEIELLATFALLQRAFRGGLEYEPEEGRYNRAFVELFLKTCRFEVPEPYRHAGGYEEWQKNFAPSLERLVKRVKEIHEVRHYDDSLTVGSGVFRNTRVKPPKNTTGRKPAKEMGGMVRLSPETVEKLFRKGIIK